MTNIYNVNSYKLRHNKLLNTYRVAYSCPKCATAFSNPISEAGQVDACTDCGCQFIVPGGKDKERIEAQEAQAKQAAHDKRQKAYEERMQRKQEHQEKLRREKAEAQEYAARAAEYEQSLNSQPEVGGDERSRNDLAYFMYPPSLIAESQSHRYHNVRFPGLSLVIRLMLTGTTMLYWLMLVVWFLTWGSMFVGLMFGRGRSEEKFIGLVLWLLGSIITYVILCWTAVLRIAIADFLRSLLSIEENGRENLS